MRSFFCMLALSCFSTLCIGQETFYSTNQSGDHQWNNPSNWALDPAGTIPASTPPSPTDNVVISDSIFHDAGLNYVHFGDILIEDDAVYHVFTGDGVSQPYIYAGGNFEVIGSLITSSDFEHQAPGSQGSGALRFRDPARFTIGDDLILNGQAKLILDNDSCGDGFTFDDLYMRGSAPRVCGQGRLIIPHQVRVWDDGGNELTTEVPNGTTPPDLTGAAVSQLKIQLCEGFKFFNDQKTCQADTNEIVEGEGDDTLPIELASFNVEVDNGQVLLSWVTASETQNDFFTVERSLDGSTFSEAGRMRGAGNSNAPLAYQFTDFQPPNGQIFYRLRQTDFDGASSLSRMASVWIRNQGTLPLIFPNPNAGYAQLTLPAASTPSPTVWWELYDLQSRKVAAGVPSSESISRGIIPIEAENPPGTYLLILFCDGKRYHSRMLIH
ncbi:MAG: T9SS type A sorting domain-containing protein [Bacteroidota bacterium]